MYSWVLHQWRKQVLGAVVVVLCSLIADGIKEPPECTEACGWMSLWLDQLLSCLRSCTFVPTIGLAFSSPVCSAWWHQCSRHPHPSTLPLRIWHWLCKVHTFFSSERSACSVPSCRRPQCYLTSPVYCSDATQRPCWCSPLTVYGNKWCVMYLHYDYNHCHYVTGNWFLFFFFKEASVKGRWCLLLSLYKCATFTQWLGTMANKIFIRTVRRQTAQEGDPVTAARHGPAGEVLLSSSPSSLPETAEIHRRQGAPTLTRGLTMTTCRLTP